MSSFHRILLFIAVITGLLSLFIIEPFVNVNPAVSSMEAEQKEMTAQEMAELIEEKEVIASNPHAKISKDRVDTMKLRRAKKDQKSEQEIETIQEDVQEKFTEDRTLTLYNLHTNETLKTTFWRDGKYVPQEMKKLNYFFRDWRSGEVTKMDPEVITLIYEVSEMLDYEKNIFIISAYRSAETNEKMRRQGRGIAKTSQHIKGKAIDVRFVGIPTETVRKAALSLAEGGVGSYPSSNFTHIDTGPVRFW